jgi:hypothetical protein
MIWLQKLLGGRPMLQVGENFRDKVLGKMVYDFIDCYGRMWLANDRWSFDRQRKGSEVVTVEREIQERSFYGGESEIGW